MGIGETNEEELGGPAVPPPLSLKLSNNGGDLMRKALLLTTPRRQKHRRPRPQSNLHLQPLSDGRTCSHLQPLALASPQGNAKGASGVLVNSVSAPALVGQPRPPSIGSRPSPQNASGESFYSGKAKSSASNFRAPKKPASAGSADLSDTGGSDSEGASGVRLELVRLRKRLHKQACDFQATKDELSRVKNELWSARAEADELRLKLTNLERIDRTKSSELLEERRKNDEMTKQVKEMSANLLSLTGSLEGGQEGSGLRKRCFKLVQQNTALSMDKRLLQRQKGWAEAKARVLQNEVTRVYLGVHDRVKDDTELEQVMQHEFIDRQFPTDEAQIYQLLIPCESVHQEAVIDFITHITHTGGQDIHGFLQSSRVFSEAIRNDCLSGLAKEFYATWRRNATLPHILRAVERIVHLQDYLAAFESYSAEITSLLGCAHAKIWVVDRIRQVMWTCVRDGDSSKTLTLKLPLGKNADLTGHGVATAAYLTQKPVNVSDAREDPRFRPEEEAGPDGHAKSLICVPITRVAKQGGKPQVRVVLEAVNKLQEPHFDSDRDGRVLKLLGKVSMEVLQVCEKSSGDTLNTKRKEAMLQLFTDHTPCVAPATLLSALERGLAEMFLSQGAALHLVSGNATMYVTMDKHSQKKLQHVYCEGMKGIVGQVAKNMNANTLLASQIEGSKYDASVDLPVIGRTAIHTVPILEGTGCLAVCQFICTERERMMNNDDGAYHPENTSHFTLLNKLLTFIKKHLDVVTPRAQTDALKPPTSVSTDDEAGRKLDSRVEKSVHFGTHGTENGEGTAQEEAAIRIQSIHRGRRARQRTARMAAEKKLEQSAQVTTVG
jgi:hypothetical protein